MAGLPTTPAPSRCRRRTPRAISEHRTFVGDAWIIANFVDAEPVRNGAAQALIGRRPGRNRPPKMERYFFATSQASSSSSTSTSMTPFGLYGDRPHLVGMIDA